MSNCSKSVLHVVSVEKDEKTSKGGKKFTLVKLNCVINQDDGQTKVGTHNMFMDGWDISADLIPKTGHFSPRYEPRTNWDSPEFTGVIVEMVPVVAGGKSFVAPAGSPKT